MTQQTIVQTLASTETFDGIKTKFEAQTGPIKNAVPISGQNAVCIAFSKSTGSPHLTVNRLKARSPYLT